MEHRTGGLAGLFAEVFGKGTGARKGQPLIGRAVHQALESLEGRVLLSANVVEVKWQGHVARANEGEYLVELRRDVDINKVAARNGFTGIEDLGGNGFYLIHTTKTVGQMQRWAAASERVKAVNPNFVMTAESTQPNDPNFVNGNQWALNNTGQTSLLDTNALILPQVGVPGADISATKAWDITRGVQDTGSLTAAEYANLPTVAVLDTGLDITHPDLQGNIWTNPFDTTDGLDSDHNGYTDDLHGWNFVTNSPDITDGEGHGTHVSGIIGARGNNAIDNTGVNWYVKIIGVKVLSDEGSGTSATILRGIQYVTGLRNEGINVVAMNLSLGGDTFPFDRVTSNAFKLAGQAGVLAVIAAGNGGTDSIGDNIDNSFSFPGKFSLNLPNVITVAATDNQDKLAFFSNFGAQAVALAAPGVQILSTIPLALDINDGTVDGLFVESGTSQATPQVTGVLALEAAVNPHATPMQLKQALLNGVDLIPSLAQNLSGPRTVSTNGRLDAYKAVKNIMNLEEKQDLTTQGNWQGFGNTNRLYGSQGFYVAGESTVFPGSVSVTGATSTLIDDSTKDARALQTVDGTTHIAGALVSSTSMLIDVPFADTENHRVSLYLVDFDKKHRSEAVEVIDPDTGAVLSGQFGQNVTNFQNGRYITFDALSHTAPDGTVIPAHIQLRVTNNPGSPNAVVSGIFIDPQITDTRVFKGTDATTGGDWRTHYGSQGAFVVGALGAFPSFATVNITNAATVTKSSSGNKNVTLENPNQVGKHVQAYLSTPSSMTLDMNLVDGNPHVVTMYLADFDKKARAERIDILDPTTGALISSQDVSDFAGGKYVSFTLSGRNFIRITRSAGPSAVLSGVFFDAPSGASGEFQGIDSTTHGDWKSIYGSYGSFIVGDTPFASNPFTVSLNGNNLLIDPTAQAVTVTMTGATGQVLTHTTKNRNALLKTQDSIFHDRLIAGFFSRTTETFDMDFTDTTQHQVSLYALDSDKQNRVQLVSIIDVNTGRVLSSQLMSKFQNGKYITFGVKGHVQVQVTRLAGQSAVVNGIFFD